MGFVLENDTQQFVVICNTHHSKCESGIKAIEGILCDQYPLQGVPATHTLMRNTSVVGIPKENPTPGLKTD